MTLTLILLAIGLILLFTLPVQPDGSGRGSGKGGMSAIRAQERRSGGITPTNLSPAAPNTFISPRGAGEGTSAGGGGVRGPGGI